MPNQSNTPLNILLGNEFTRLINSLSDAAAWVSMGDILYKQGNGYSFSNLNPIDVITINANALTATLCYKRAIELNPQVPDYWWRLGTTCKPNETITIADERYDERKCYIKSLMLNKNNAMAWCRLGSTMKADESITFHLGQNKISYCRQTCFVTSISMEPENPHIWSFVASLMADAETFSLKGEQYNRIKCYSKLLELKDLEPSIQTKAWIALNIHLDKDQSCSIAGVPYSKDECAFKALISDNSNNTLSIQAPKREVAPNLFPAPTAFVSPPAQTVSVFPPAQTVSVSPPAPTASVFPPSPTAFVFPPALTAFVIRPAPTASVRDLASHIAILKSKDLTREFKNDRINPNLEKSGILFIGWESGTETREDGRRHCLTCKEELSAHYSWADHVLTKGHQSAIDENATSKAKGDPTTEPHYCCVVCHCIISGDKNANTHKEGLRHKRRVELMKVCTCCDYVYCSSDENFAHKEYTCASRASEQQPVPASSQGSVSSNAWNPSEVFATTRVAMLFTPQVEQERLDDEANTQTRAPRPDGTSK